MRVVGIWTLLVIVGVALGTAIDSSYGGAQNTSGPKLGFINTDRILEEAKVVKEKREELKKASDKTEADLQQALSQLNEKARDLQAKKDILQPDAYNQQKTDLDKQYIDWRASRRQKEQDLTELYKETIRPIRTQINKVVEEIAKEEGFTFVFMHEYIAYGAAQHDITQRVINRLNK